MILAACVRDRVPLPPSAAFSFQPKKLALMHEGDKKIFFEIKKI